MAMDEVADGFEAGVECIEIDGGDDGLCGVGQQGGLVAAPVLLGAFAEEEKLGEAEGFAEACHALAADQSGAHTGEFAFGAVRELAVEGFGDDEAEDGVAEEFELLVVGSGGIFVLGEESVFGLAAAGFVGEGTVGEGEAEQSWVGEGVAEELLEGLGGRVGWGVG